MVIVEANIITIAEAIRDAMRDRGTPDVVFMNEVTSRESAQHNDIPGSITTRRNKPEIFRLLIDEYFVQKKIVFYKHFVVAESKFSYVSNVKQEFIKQLRNFCEKKVERTAPDGTTYFELMYTGKNSNNNDDFVLALGIGVFMHKRFFESDAYRVYWKL